MGRRNRTLFARKPFMNARAASVILGLGAMLIGMSQTPALAEADPGKKACVQEARRLCPAEMKSLSRKKVEACMIAKINETSPVCHAAMLRIRAERQAAAKR
ncbi:hypothetical protein [Novosphingobium sp. BK486]|uniref:hypothetical protein n=1 Tax=unclassified Novosphingobium TaxID=2644732 RepID=UPI0017EFF5C0|nr:hypothetical protein [Novosphingobium sp. BK256]MBB3373107.1 hypothetical protein [Novosphingobium sp. BK280]MBB3377475.1 hypothetical protein [Novosphingobium sp. BK258]MBB3419114.1 hypothetical protein [Novosphingobium sp. BK267]MBB3449069.1 hypothetical protein [Novosphingobium sp. BK352]MBB3535380.1 hypothetical protein [Novosphingobium sp. BK486]MBB3554777.1 hypothetical protein [Novosphingobium sp. BK349]MBB3596496.1 hypothetical protein [Novosphingobium sp. BK540]MBB3650828.1 hypo